MDPQLTNELNKINSKLKLLSTFLQIPTKSWTKIQIYIL